MASLTPAELAALKAKRDSLQDAYDALISGSRTVESRYGDMAERFHQADAAKLEKRIAQLNDQIARAEGVRRGGFVVRF
jgi:transcription elongation GreA/GreB family factor